MWWWWWWWWLALATRLACTLLFRLNHIHAHEPDEDVLEPVHARALLAEPQLLDLEPLGFHVLGVFHSAALEGEPLAGDFGQPGLAPRQDADERGKIGPQRAAAAAAPKAAEAARRVRGGVGRVVRRDRGVRGFGRGGEGAAGRAAPPLAGWQGRRRNGGPSGCAGGRKNQLRAIWVGVRLREPLLLRGGLR